MHTPTMVNCKYGCVLTIGLQIPENFTICLNWFEPASAPHTGKSHEGAP